MAQSILITGASTGIGEATALFLDREGFEVFAGVRKPEDGAKLKAQSSGKLIPVIIDVTKQDTIDTAVKFVNEKKSGEFVGLVNNAGIAIAGPLEFLPLEDLRYQLEVNVVGQVAVTQAFLPLLRQTKGRIVMVGSVSGRLTAPFLAPYSASKFALDAITASLRMELKSAGIFVSLVEPGPIKTPIWEKSAQLANQIEAKISEEAKKTYAKEIDAIRKAAKYSEETGIPAVECAKAIFHALTNGRPKNRYLVGLRARVQAGLVQFMPEVIREPLILKTLGIE